MPRRYLHQYCNRHGRKGILIRITSESVDSTAPQGILDRYGQVLPKFVFSETEAIYAGKTIDMLLKIKEIASDLSSKGLQHVILLPSIRTGLEPSLEAVEGVSLRSVSNYCCVGKNPK